MTKNKRMLTNEERDKIAIAKQELNEYRENIKYIDEKLQDAEEIKSKIEKVTSIISETRTSANGGNSDKFADAISRLDELKIDCTKKMKDLLLKKFIIDNKIEGVGQPYTNILFYRYTRGKGWNDIAEQLGYTREYVCDLHGEALYLYTQI